MNKLNKFVSKIANEGLNETVVDSFSYYYKQVVKGFTGMLSESMIKPPENNFIIDYNTLREPKNSPLEKLVVIKLNGGLGTSMGLSKAKSLLPVKDHYNFLDILVKQVLKLRDKTGYDIPLLFMNSFNTRYDTMQYLEKYPQLKLKGLPIDFLQNKYPKVRKKDLLPLSNPSENKNWNPPGHGEIYTVLITSGVLDILLEKGYQYAFISNSDNLGAITDSKILSYMIAEKIPFLMEVCERTEMDKKGGHLAQTINNQLILREIAQCLPEEKEQFQDIHKYRYFNTNNLWIDLTILKDYLTKRNNFLQLPLILNQKLVDGEEVYQIETAMGAAINTFEGSKAIVVPRRRFVPVKKTNDLLAVWSDAYQLDNMFNLVLDGSLKKSPSIDLDDNFKFIDQLSERFSSIPSLKFCNRLEVKGDISFGPNVVCKGECSIISDSKITINNITIDNEKVRQ